MNQYRVMRRCLIHLVLILCLAESAWAAPRTGTASWFSTETCRLNPDPRCPTASGKSLYALEARGILFAATNTYPLGTRLNVCRADHMMPHELPRRRGIAPCVVVTVEDRGPARRLGRIVDLSTAAFAMLAPLDTGLLLVEVQEATP